jgi:hypothetical protein
MSDRRKAQRFAVAGPANAQLHLAQDVVIERADVNRLTVLAEVSSMPGEEFALRLRGPDGQTATLSVCTVESRVVMLESGCVRHRLELLVVDGSGASPDAL